MLEKLRRRRFAETTIPTDVHGVTYFSPYFRRPNDQLGPENIRKNQTMGAVVQNGSKVLVCQYAGYVLQGTNIK
jgi:hypothetical protein